jgi:HEAT repeat protein
MISLFREANGEARLNAIEAVAYLGSAAVPALTRALSHKDINVRRGSCEALKLIGPPAKPAIAELAKLLSEPGYDVAFEAEGAMKSILCGARK